MLVIGDHLWTYSAIIVLNANENNKNMACASNAERVTGRGGPKFREETFCVYDFGLGTQDRLRTLR